MKKLFYLFVPVFLGSCSVKDDAVRHLLEPSIPRSSGSSSRPGVAIARPTLPPYLERSELVTRSGPGTLEIHEKELWSEPLDKGIARVVADNLRRLTRSTNVQPAANFIAQDYRKLVEIRIERFDPLPDGSVVLECTWKAQPVGGGEASMRSFNTIVPIPEGPYLGMKTVKHSRIPAMNEALARLSRTIAGSL